MVFKDLAELIQMGGHGVYVWTAFIITLSALIIIQVYARYEHKKNQQLLNNLKNEEKK